MIVIILIASFTFFRGKMSKNLKIGNNTTSQEIVNYILSINSYETKVEVEVITDSAFQQKAAGDYASLDQKTVITLNSDFTVTTKNYKKNYYKWEFMVQPQGSEANIMLASKGMDTDIKDQAIIDVEEGKIVVNNETFRKAAK